MAVRGVPELHRWLIYAAGIVMICLTAQSIRLGHEVRLSLQDLATAETDNLQWTLSQIEVDHLKYLNSAQTTVSELDLSALRRNFDIYYSRIVTVSESNLYAAIRRGQTIERLSRLNAGLQAQAALIDGPNTELLAQRGRLVELIQADRQDIREMALSGVVLQAEFAGEKRNHLYKLFADLAVVLIALVCALLTTALVLMRLYRRGQQLAARIAQDAARMETMVGASLDAVVMADREGRIIAMSESGETLFGVLRGDALGRSIEALVPDIATLKSDRAGSWLSRLDLEERGEEGRFLLTAQRGDMRFPAELSLSISHSGANPVLVSYIRDISTRLRAEEDLRQARDDALAGERAKARLLTVMSHEMRTPLNGILGSLDMLERQGLPAHQLRYLEAMRVSGDLLLHHVNDVLELSRLEAGAEPEAPQVFDLAELVQGLVDSQQANAAKNKNELSAFCSLGPDLGVRGAHRSLQQVLLNLIGNALKFTENGAVSVDVVRHAGDTVEFSIADTGKGIAAEDLTRIFDEFAMVDPSYRREAEGTGLGLAITRRLVANMGGEIRCDSELGEGSIFSFSIPLPACAISQVTQPQVEVSSTRPQHVLVIEDNEINRFLLEEMLAGLGHEVSSASGGAEGLQMIEDGLYDLIISDISMPEVDGMDVIRRARAEHLADETDIVALTAHAAAEDHARILAAGFAEVLTKPVGRDDLASLIARWCGAAADAPVTTPPDQANLGGTSDIDQFVTAVGVAKARDYLGEFQLEVVQLTHALEDAPNLTEDLRQEAHRLAGSAAVLGLAQLRQCLLDIETAEADFGSEGAQLMAVWQEAEGLIAPFVAA
ncbi:ATP-binding protein [Tritonibacter multivorans]|nr:ATP-binding protein [Tritonibacter multivorans]MDA7420772.1 ATP-binding protein [Tritonibacter multivorans]